MVSPVFNTDPQASMLHHDANQPLGDINAEAHRAFWHNDGAPVAEPKPEAQHFDSDAHRAFMRGLG